MPISLIRIDDRLVHGQVVESWVPHLNIREIIVISDEIASDEMRKTIMRFATPDNVNLKILNIAEAADYIPEIKASEKNLMLLLPGLKEAVELINKGLHFASINIGGMHFSAGKNFCIGKAIFLSDEDCRYLKLIAQSGVRIEGRGVPSDASINLLEALT
ncbi:MAG: PTS sugar transporter subunit IIB [Elusimicrobia bacterium]|nr:PTS sugar transporter subunit IIB [Elusimicrobiota bacterium]